MSDPEGDAPRQGREPTLPRTSLLTVRVYDKPPEPAEPASPAPAEKAPPEGPPASAPGRIVLPPPPPAPRLVPRPALSSRTLSGGARVFIATLFGLVLAVGVHLAVVLALPRFAEQDAFSRLRGTADSETAVLVSGAGGAETWMPSPDPAAAVAACAFNLDDGPVRVSARTGALFQALTVHARGGGVFYAVTDRAAVRGELDLVVMTRSQLDEALAAEDEDEPSRDVRIVSPRTEGFVIVRVVAPLPSLRPDADVAAKAVSCTIETDEDEPDAPLQAAPTEPGRR